MPKKRSARAIEELVRKELDNHGIIGCLSMDRQGERAVARLEFTEASSMKRVAKLVWVGQMEGQEVAFGLDIPEGALKEILLQAFGAADALRELVPLEVEVTP